MLYLKGKARLLIRLPWSVALTIQEEAKQLLRKPEEVAVQVLVDHFKEATKMRLARAGATMEDEIKRKEEAV